MQKKRIKFFTAFLIGTGLFVFGLLFFLFIKAVKYKKVYKASQSYYRIFPHLRNKTEEDNRKIISQFRVDDAKTGVVPGAFTLQGRVKSFYGKINGSLHNASKATPAVDKSGVYVGSDSGWFYKFNHAGRLIWKTYFAKTEQGVHGTALLSEKYLWVGAYNGLLYCLKKRTGEVMWSIHLGDAIGSSPSFYKGRIIVSVELLFPRFMGYVAAVSARDGRLIWKTPLTSAHIHSSVAVHREKGYGVTGANNGFLFKVDLHTGRILWALQMKGAIKSTPLLYDSRIYVSNWGPHFEAVNEEGKKLWSTHIKSRSQSSPTWIPGKKYLIFSTHPQGRLFSLSAEDGAVLWEKEIENDNALASGVSFFSQRHKRYVFLFPCETKSLCLIDPVDGKVLKKIPTGFLLTGSFAFFKERFFMSFNSGGLSVLY